MSIPVARDQGSSRPNPSFFGSIDPFCWIMVIPLLLVAVFTTLEVSLPVGLGLVALGVVVLLVDATINWRWYRTWGNKPVSRDSRPRKR
ncbi:hypothetical protein [Actinopolyspora mortivallis]|uniref:Uncharacterized protein n=1 Tax=Actinopolyspora mortivallis TaxID=33906 RepID=A0A2T0H0I6_ACTMO|nr:hypothetical protein [Actinopolyspora mortivallis]PRW64869.1 hypothetical protein CEP50_03380 [Actinopolyspora mortivallis]